MAQEFTGLVTPFSSVEEQMERLFPPETHPFRHLERAIEQWLSPTSNILDVGCGRRAPVLRRFVGRAAKLYGVDVVEFSNPAPEGLILLNHDVCQMDEIQDGIIDLAYSKAVMEHVAEPVRACVEINRILKPGGVYIFITPSIYDYGSIIASVVPNSLHPKIVNFVEGRAEENVFPTLFRSNSRKAIEMISAKSGLLIREFRYLGQYPNYFAFNRVLFWIGSIYQKIIERFRITQPLQGWIFCVLQKPCS